MESNKQEIPITNCHTHIFTRDHVPRLIGKSFIFWPFYHFANVYAITELIRRWLRFREKQIFNKKSIYNLFKRNYKWLQNLWWVKISIDVLAIWLTVTSVLNIILWLSHAIRPISGLSEKLVVLLPLITKILPFTTIIPNGQGLLVLFITFLIFPNSRKIIYATGLVFLRFLRYLPGKQTVHLLERYILLGRFSLYKEQSGVFSRLKNQYPPRTRFVVLPMDMEYMAAGKVSAKGRFRTQMQDLINIRKGNFGNLIEPFVFVDPRRIRDKKSFFKYSIGASNELVLEKCDVKQYIEKHNFSGFKIYPALGYYPFDEDLLPLWKYAADNQIPIMTHVIKGTIFYRGKKQKAWNQHPVFREFDRKKRLQPLELSQKKNIDFTPNFTHPLNYLCLLKEPLLRKVVADASNPKVRRLFGYSNDQTPLKYNLSNLKICLAHYGGEVEWVKYLESDRYAFSQRLIRNRSMGIDFKADSDSTLSWNVLEQIWKKVDWYSIISSLIMQSNNVYADISYILSKPRIIPLLKETLDEKLNPHIRHRVLFGTDFYVVRNHFSEKDLLAQLKGALSDKEFDLIARKNPQSYLN